MFFLFSLLSTRSWALDVILQTPPFTKCTLILKKMYFKVFLALILAIARNCHICASGCLSVLIINSFKLSMFINLKFWLSQFSLLTYSQSVKYFSFFLRFTIICKVHLGELFLHTQLCIAGAILLFQTGSFGHLVIW